MLPCFAGAVLTAMLRPFPHLASSRASFLAIDALTLRTAGSAARTRQPFRALGTAERPQPRTPLEPLAPMPSGILVVDKPANWTSNDVTTRIRNTLEKFCKKLGHRIMRKRRLKVGHGGTLDPLATGVLVVGVGQACKQLSAYSQGGKRYLAKAQFGSETDTQDKTGNVTCTTGFEHVTLEALLDAAKPLTGEIMQRPPIYSALWKDGVRMHELARAGKIEEADVELRPVTVYDLQIQNFDPQQGSVELIASVSGGTYIRTLIVDLARSVKSSAHMTELRRLQHGPFASDSEGQIQVEPIQLKDFYDHAKLLKAMEETSELLANNVSQ
ncbi:hypothetical protein AB1Y20_013022 [Prymnesium parvum]|uniref:tRNA pseudouridine(55) synthase n=1 Tax=Prymnesium parvum TaxID=97485 RepID=A0AB34IJG8_PRYPA